MRKFNDNWRLTNCEKCGRKRGTVYDAPKIQYIKFNTDERNNLERLTVTCDACGYSYDMECDH